MDYEKQKKAQKMKIGNEKEEEEDRISKLSDDLIHEIMLFIEDSRLAVQTCILSKRWKFVWKTLPYLNFHGGSYNQHYKKELNKFIYDKFISYVFAERNHQCQLLKLDLCAGLSFTFMRRYVRYAILHNVETLNVDLDRYCVLSMFNSCWLKELKVTMPFEYYDVMESDCWSLPTLTTLNLNRCEPVRKYAVKYREGVEYVGRFPQSCLVCLSALTTLGLNNCKLPKFFSLPCLTTLYLVKCTFPENVWELPDLLTLEVDNVVFPKSLSEYFLPLANLRNLAINFNNCIGISDCLISGLQLVNLKIRAFISTGKFVVSAPKLCNFTAIGFFPITFESCEPENVEIEVFRSNVYHSLVDRTKILECSGDQYKMMFSQLGSAKNLTLDLETLEELSKSSNFLVHLESPLYNLKHLKLPLGCKAPSISSIVRQYLLGASPKATIVERPRASSQVNVIPQNCFVTPKMWC